MARIAIEACVQSTRQMNAEPIGDKNRAAVMCGKINQTGYQTGSKLRKWTKSNEKRKDVFFVDKKNSKIKFIYVCISIRSSVIRLPLRMGWLSWETHKKCCKVNEQNNRKRKQRTKC